MKRTVILSAVVFLASTVMAAIDNDPPRLVVWAGAAQFVVAVIAAVIYAWWSRVPPSRQRLGEANRSPEDTRHQ